MKKRYLPGVYRSGDTLLHQLPISYKLGLMGIYVVVLFMVTHLLPLICLWVILQAGVWRMKLASTKMPIIRTLILTAVAFALTAINDTRLVPLSGILALVIKVLMINELVRWYSQTTPVEDTIHCLQHRTRAVWVKEWSFLISMTLALYPGIQRDLGRAVDAEHLRLNRRPAWWMWGTWFGILKHTLVRTVNRAHSLGANLVERGFTLDGDFTLLTIPTPSRANWGWGILCALPAIITLLLWWVMR